ncbi:hypothetical protein [Streptomyces sp. Ac-502]|uniref:hypothetical protein n=1 Tax=Streptomyces sp. Ac-502 TaxID=3342801 RepID=UPI0038628F7D
MTGLLAAGLRSTAPPALRVRRQMTVVIDEHNAPEPDVTVVRAAAVRGADQLHLVDTFRERVTLGAPSALDIDLTAIRW